jgi:nucleotide-binding universal stress UspA family protein
MNTAKKIVLVPVDFSAQSLVALHHAEVITKALNGELHIMHVIDEPSAIANFFSEADNDKDKLTEKVWLKMNELEKSLGEKNIHAHTLVAKGKIYEEVVRVAELIGSSFIVMGTNGADGIVKRFIGSNALRVVRESRVPVISIKGKPMHDGFSNIVLPLDLSKETREKVNKAIELSRQFDAVIHVVSMLLTDDEEVIKKLKLQLNQVEKFLERAEVKYTSELAPATKKSSEFSEEILNYTKKVNGDLLMIMTQQEKDFSERFIGSAAQELINNSEIPVCSIVPSVKKNTVVFKPY